MNEFQLTDILPELNGKTLADVLLEPTKIYVKSLLPLVERQWVNGIAHVTGGGFVENIPRMLPDDLAAVIELGNWPILPVFSALEKYGQIPSMEMYEIFNMGIGMVLAVSPEMLTQVQELLEELGEKSYRLGEITKKEDAAIRFAEAEK